MAELLSPLTQTPYPDATDNAIEDLLEVPDMVLHAERYWVMRFTSAANRDAAIPVPVRGMTCVIGTTVATSFLCFYDGSTWRGASNTDTLLAPDAGFPVALSGITTTEGVASRITIPARPVARRLVVSGSLFCTYTQTEQIDVSLYLGASQIGRARKKMEATIGESIHVISTPTSMAENVGGVVEMRVVRVTGTGTIATVSTSALSTLQVTLMAT